MSDNQVNLLLIVGTLAVCMAVIYFYFAFTMGVPTTVDEENLSRPIEIPDGRKKFQPTPFRDIVQAYEKSRDVDSLVIVIYHPERIVDNPKKHEPSRIRALAVSRLLRIPGTKARKAYRDLLRPTAPQAVTLAALSALTKDHTDEKILSTLRNLALQTKDKLVRAKASLTLQNLTK